MQDQPNTKGRRSQTSQWLLGALAATGLGALAAVFWMSSGGSTATDEPTIPRGAGLAAWSENGQGGRHLLQIADGNTLPAGATISGTVVSDTQCEPDARGFSHCRNAIELASGVRITVIDTHMMSRQPCLEPGQRLSLTSLDPTWIVGASL